MAKLCALVVGLAAASAVAQSPLMPPWPLQSTVEAAYNLSAATPLQRNTGLRRDDYLTTIHAVVQFFRQYQNATGHIIDPYRGLETQYSTPCFAFACASVWAQGMDATLLSNCTSALSASLTELATHNCADGHCVFFMKPALFAYRVMNDKVEPSLKAAWDNSLETMNPWTDFGFPHNNWGLVGTLDMLRTTYITQFGNSSWWQAMLTFQLGEPATTLTANGLYQDHTGADGLNPLPYDVFPVAGYLNVIVREAVSDTNGTHAPLLEEVTTRAAWTHMLMQSPWGEIPTGGRSSQHTWNEAVSTIAYEIQATRYAKEGDIQAACMFKRAAHLSHESIRRWQNTNGSLQIVKNHFPPEDRWGYEEYSYFSQYQLLPVSMLSAAWLYAEDDSVPECSAPADTGGFVFELPEHHLVIANAGGVYAEIETLGDPKYEPSGLNRVHINTCGVGAASSCVAVNALLGPSAGPPFYPTSPDTGIATGPWWSMADAPSNISALAQLGLHTITGHAFLPGWNTAPRSLNFAMEYYLLAQGLVVTQDYTVSVQADGSSPLISITHAVAAQQGQDMLARAAQHGVDLSAHVQHMQQAQARGVFAPGFTASPQGTLARFGLEFPALLFDGQTNTTVSLNNSSNSVTIAGPSSAKWGSVTHTVEAATSNHTQTWTYRPELQVVGRNGPFATVWVETTVDTQSPSLSSNLTASNV